MHSTLPAIKRRTRYGRSSGRTEYEPPIYAFLECRLRPSRIQQAALVQSLTTLKKKQT